MKNRRSFHTFFSPPKNSRLNQTCLLQAKFLPKLFLLYPESTVVHVSITSSSSTTSIPSLHLLSHSLLPSISSFPSSFHTSLILLPVHTRSGRRRSYFRFSSIPYKLKYRILKISIPHLFFISLLR